MLEAPALDVVACTNKAQRLALQILVRRSQVAEHNVRDGLGRNAQLCERCVLRSAHQPSPLIGLDQQAPWAYLAHKPQRAGPHLDWIDHGKLFAHRAARIKPPRYDSAVQAMVLAAGLGTRLWPLTADRGKPSVPFLGRPLIQGIVELLAQHGFDRAVVNTHHRPESIRTAISGASAGKMQVRLSHEPEILGTAGCIAKALSEGALAQDEPVLVINAKLHTNVDLAKAMQAHQRSGAEVTMVLKPNAARAHFREVLIEGAPARVVGFGEGRVPKGPDPLLFTGIHVLSPKVCASIPIAFCDTIHDIYPPLIEAGTVHAHLDRDSRWWEFSTVERYFELHQRAAALGMGDPVSLSPGARIDQGASVQRSILWEDAAVQANARVDDCVLGAGVQIRSGESIKGFAVIRAELAQTPQSPHSAQPPGEPWGDRLRVPLALDGNGIDQPGP